MTTSSKYFPSQPPPKTGSSPALRIACPACSAPAGSYCTKFRVDQGPDGSRRPIQVIAHKRRREEEERTR